MPETIQPPTAGLSVVDKLRMLLDITKTISRSLDLDEVLNLVMDTLDSLIPYDAAGIYLVKCSRPLPEWEGGLDETCVFHTQAVRGYDIDDMKELSLKMGEGLIGYVALKGKPFTSPDVRKEPRYINARARTRSEMVAPIISNNEVIGVFDLESDELNAYGKDDLEILMLLSSQVAIIIEKVMLHEQLIEKQRLETQLEIARQVQLQLLPPRDPELEGFDISAYNFPTEEVSGDYYDWVRIYDDQIALLMAFLRASLRAATHIGYSPHISMSKVNYLLWESIERNQFVTAFYGTLDATNRTLAYSNAGHNPPFLIDVEGKAHFEERGGVPLGMFRDSRYYEYYATIDSGQMLVLYTDGVTEAMNPAGEEYGLDRLVDAALRGRHLSAREMIDFIHQDVIDWTDGLGATDDVTFFIVKAL